jgi:hypothetical protein
MDSDDEPMLLLLTPFASAAAIISDKLGIEFFLGLPLGFVGGS